MSGSSPFDKLDPRTWPALPNDIQLTGVAYRDPEAQGGKARAFPTTRRTIFVTFDQRSWFELADEIAGKGTITGKMEREEN